MITKITIMLEDRVHPLAIKEFVDRLTRTFKNVDYVKSDGVILIETKQEVTMVDFPRYCNGFEACVYDVSITHIDNSKEEYWDELGNEIGFTTADKLLS